MSKTRISEPGLEPVTLAEVKQFLRIETADENALLSMWISQAREACETFIGRALITQDWRLVEQARTSLELRPGPVQSIVSVTYDDGISSRVLTADEYELQSQNGLDRIVFDPALGGGEVSVEFRAGYGDDWNAVPLSIRQGLLRLVAHHHRFRDAADAPALPAAVTALWRPFRVLGL